jgi:Uma2 family endonuclease
MVMAALLRQFTIEDIDTFPDDGNRYELLNGVLLVTPGPGLPHQSVALELAAELRGFLQLEPGIRVWNPATIRIPPLIHLEPDILVGTMPSVPDWEAVREHWLAVEVSGVGSRAYDRDYKRDSYLQLGVKEVWLVDLDLRQIFVSGRDGNRDTPHDSELTWRSPGGRVLTLDIPALFRGLPT